MQVGDQKLMIDLEWPYLQSCACFWSHENRHNANKKSPNPFTHLPLWYETLHDQMAVCMALIDNHNTFYTWHDLVPKGH